MANKVKALFAHDHRFFQEGVIVYSESQYSTSLWARYLRHFDELTVFARLGEGEIDKSKAEISSAEKVSFVLTPSLSSVSAQLLRKREVKSRLRAALDDVDAVIARLPSELGLMAVSEARQAGIPYAVELVTCPWDALWNYGSSKGKLYAPVMAARVRSAVRSAGHVMYVTQQFLQERYPNSQGVTVSCSNVEIGEPDIRALVARLNRIKLQPEVKVLGLIGTLKTRYKGIQTVLEALGEVRKVVPSIEFRVIGSGDATPWKKEAAYFAVADIVKFQGTLPGGAPVLKWLDDVDLYLQPSFQEGLPRALIEAMSRGCPAVASRCAGIPEIIEGSCLIEPGDASHLSELIISGLSDLGWQAQQAHRNWLVSGEYASSVLDERRRGFWARVAEAARARQSASA